jgi:hypothetical protein
VDQIRQALTHLRTTTCKRMPNHGDEEEVEEEEGCEEVIRISFDISATPLWCFAKAAGQKSGRFAFGRGSPTGQLFMLTKVFDVHWVDCPTASSIKRVRHQMA